MFIDKLDGNWLQHPFWKSAFRLDNPKQLKTLQESAVTHVWIDTDKGLDVANETGSSTANETTATPSPTVSDKTIAPQRSIPIEKEMSAARETLEKARQATMAVLQEARMGNSISTADVAPLVEEISASIERNASAMLTVSRMKTKDDYTYLHSVAVCALMIALGKQLNYQGSLHALGMAGLLHDVGKMSIPDEILNKPGKLTDDEFKVVLEHPRNGWELLKQSDNIDDIALDVCLHHHERVDGNGYPDKLSGEVLTLEARMGAICDVYDAITSDRCYKKGWEPAYALKKMAEWKDGHFDETIFQAFVKTIGIYPSGTLLKLKSGRLAVVTDQGPQSLLTPIIKVFYSCNSKAPIQRKLINLAQSNEQIDSVETPQDWGFSRRDITDILDQ